MFRGYSFSTGSVIARSDSRKRTRIRVRQRIAEKRSLLCTLVFALRRVRLVHVQMQRRDHAARDIYEGTGYPWMRLPTEEDRSVEAWFFLVIKNYAPRPVWVKARGFVNIFRLVRAFGLAKRRDKVGAYFPGSLLAPTPTGPPNHPLSSFIHFPLPFFFFFFSVLSFFRSFLHQSEAHPPPTIIFPDFPVGILISFCRQRTIRARRCGKRSGRARDNVLDSSLIHHRPSKLADSSPSQLRVQYIADFLPR